MKVGITGTREGMDVDQIECVYNLLTEIMSECNNLSIVPEFHHGDCVGVDVQAAIIAKELKYKVIAHPGPAGELQAGHASDEIRENITHFKRNRNIVNECDVLVVVPMQDAWQSKGGTWYTASYAKKKGKPYFIIYPGGRQETDN